MRRLRLVIGLSAALCATTVWAAETADPVAMTKTVIALKLDAGASVPFKTITVQQPPGLRVEFSRNRVTGALPERSTVGRGPVQAIVTQYEGQGGSRRFIRSLQVVLNAPYAYRVRSEASRIVVEIDHPAAIGGSDIEVGLKGGTIIGAMAPRATSERFQAMQHALAGAAPTTWTLRAGPPTPAAHAPAPPASSEGISQRITSMTRPTPEAVSSAVVLWLFATLGIVLVGGGLWWAVRSKLIGAPWALPSSAGNGAVRSSGMILVDQLVWRAFERQGYQLLLEKDVIQGPRGTLRVIAKDGAKAALLCAGNGPFFEKQTVERFVRLMRGAQVGQGFLVAAGSFTVPAQRVAKAHQVTLIGREELTELLSVGATSEHFARQLEAQRIQLEESKEALRHTTEELEALRLQRNEASWYLGEERAQSAKIEADLASLTEQMRQRDLELTRWEEEATKLRKHWEESEWYLGEARARVQHLEGQRDASLGELQQQVEDLRAREQALAREVERLNTELRALRTHWGERRDTMRVRIPDALVELSDSQNALVFSGALQDLSLGGLGITAERTLPGEANVRMTLPGAGEPVQSSARLVWQHNGESATRYQSGWQFTGLSPEARASIARVMERAQPSPG